MGIPTTEERRIHYAELNIMILNIMAVVFIRMLDQAPFFTKPLNACHLTEES
jgi:hypothetical protein